MSHLTAAFAERAVQELFKGIVKNFVLEEADSMPPNDFTASYDIKLHLDGGSVELTNQNSLVIHELDVKWDRILLSLTVDLPKVCTPDGCIEIFGKEICIPQWCIFEGENDIDIDFDLAPYVRTSEISGELRPVVKYFVHPDRTPSMNYLVAEETPDPDFPDDPEKNLADRWQVFLDPIWLDIDLIDFEAIVEELLDALVDAIVDTVFAGFPGWAKDAILAITGPLIDFIGDAIDLVDDFDEWLSDLFNISFGLGDLILNLLADYFAHKTPIVDLENPYPVMEAENGLIPVKIPLEKLSVHIDTHEMVLEGSVGTSLGV